VHILNDNTVRFRTTLNPTSTKQLLINGAGSMGETDVTIPGAQIVAPANLTVDAFNADQFRSSADGAHYIWGGDLNGGTTTDGIVVVDGNVVAQEGAELPGGVLPGVNVGLISSGSDHTYMSPSGSWATRMPLADTTDIVLANGQVKARTDQAIFTGAANNWDDTNFAATFFLNATNDAGDVVVGGLINADVTRDAVLVYYGASGSAFVLATEGDPVDVDGNGQFDDNAFIDIFGDDDGVLTNDGHYYFVAALQDADNVSIGNAFLSMPVPEPTTTALLAPFAAMLIARRRRR
jgi:hypothetical protein